MKKILITIATLVGVIVVGASIYAVVSTESDNEPTSNEQADDPAVYFTQEIRTQALEALPGRPIEGLTQEMYMQVYPGLEVSDFSGVETVGDTLPAGSGSSAEARITDDGLQTLLANVTDRLDLSVDTRADITDLLARLQSSGGETASTTKRDTDEGFTATTEYQGDQLWQYTVTGGFPNPCYEYSMQTNVAESYPEQVALRMTVTPPVEGERCIQWLENLHATGTYQASRQASFSFDVIYEGNQQTESSRATPTSQ